ncbi:DUF4170 domain-containing protein [Ponticoccus alexandrii]|uniref:DUF4170 domain-containing protein n=2 Tax=Ponticoccus alexandrii TaxID=1943633 RepID=A0ABX7F4D6_9RHOB|nr:DUF4170 domain-containing protein [Ponticoccus alexandrii]
MTRVALNTNAQGGRSVMQRLHLVFGGELVDPTKSVFRNVDDIQIVGIFPDYDSAYNAWKAEAQRTVDNAHMRYFIAHLHRLREEEQETSSTEELG